MGSFSLSLTLSLLLYLSLRSPVLFQNPFRLKHFTEQKSWSSANNPTGPNLETNSGKCDLRGFPWKDMLQLCWDFKPFGEPGSKFYYWKFFLTYQIFDGLVFYLLTPAVDSVFNEKTWKANFQSVTCLISPCYLLPCSYYTG